MRALVLSDWGQAADFAEIDEPAVTPGECLVEVDSVLIGAGDVFFTQGVDYKDDGASFDFPHVPGFRGCGVVLTGAPGAPEVGTRVAINGVGGCNACPRCAAGAENLCPNKYLLGLSPGHFGSAAELVAAPASQLHPLPDEMSFTDALLAADAALLIHAFKRGRLAIGESLAILGAGRIGTMAAAVAEAAGADPIVAIDTSRESLAAAERAGATDTIDVTGLSDAEIVAAVQEACGAAPEIVLEAVGKAETIRAALAVGRGGARTILLGILGGVELAPDYYSDVISKENELITTFGKTNDDFGAAIRLIGRQQINCERLPVASFGWDDALRAWEESASAAGARNAIAVARNGASERRA